MTPAAASPQRPALTFERMSCFGDCPAYELTLFEDGRLEYVGPLAVPDWGPAEARMTPEVMAKIRSNLARVAALRSDCCHCAGWTDDASVKMTFPVPGGTEVKTIDHYFGCESAPDWLFDVENAIDEALGTERWLGRRVEYQARHPSK